MTRTAKMEILSDALDAMNRADAAGDDRGFVRAESRLLDAALDCGMPHNEPSVNAWAAERVGAWMLAA